MSINVTITEAEFQRVLIEVLNTLTECYESSVTGSSTFEANERTSEVLYHIVLSDLEDRGLIRSNSLTGWRLAPAGYRLVREITSKAAAPMKNLETLDRLTSILHKL